MKKSFAFLVLILFLSFLGCSKNDDEKVQNQYGPMKRNITQSDIDCLQYVTVYNYDIGWSFLNFSSSKDHFDPESKNIYFFIDLVEYGEMKDGTYKCKDTESFKRFANFKCNEVDYEPNDVIQITKNSENNYTILFSFTEDEQLFQGTYTGVVDFLYLAIDHHMDCY